MTDNILISRFSSLNFSKDWKLGFQIDVTYQQRFIPSDRITVQFAVPSGNDQEFSSRILNTAGSVRIVTPVQIDSSAEYTIYNISVTGLPIGEYTFQLIQSPDDPIVLAQAGFSVCDTVEDTVLIGYTNRRNDFDTVFSDEKGFQFRVEGVFLPSEKSFLVEEETFRDQRYSLSQLSAMPYSKEILSVGGGFGVPNWVAEKLNLIFSLSGVYVDGVPYVRSEGSTPEMTLLQTYYPLFVYKIELEKKTEYNQPVTTYDVYPIVTEYGNPVTGKDGSRIYG